MTSCDEIIEQLRALGQPGALEGMARYGMNTTNRIGISIPALRSLAKSAGKNHQLALDLWTTGIADARILAAFVDDPRLVTEAQMDTWVADFDSWDVCDQCCYSLFDRTPFAVWKAKEWSARPEEFVKRAGFALMAALAVHDKRAADEQFLDFLAIVETGAADERNFVKKAVNWALRQIGKRNSRLHQAAIEVAGALKQSGSKAARWVGSDALRELTGDAVTRRLHGSAAPEAG